MTKSTALVVIDVQRVMFETPGYVLHDGLQVVETIKGLISSARKAGVPVVFIQHTTEGKDSEFEKDSHNWQVITDIAPQEGDTRCLKYSYDSFNGTDLNAKLKELGATRLIFCGLQTEVCVDTTVRSALAHGYESVLVGDAHSSYDNGVLTGAQIVAHHNTVLNRRFCTVMNAADVEF